MPNKDNFGFNLDEEGNPYNENDLTNSNDDSTSDGGGKAHRNQGAGLPGSWESDRSNVFEKLKWLERINSQQIRTLNRLSEGHTKIDQTLQTQQAKREAYRNLWTLVGSVLAALVAVLELLRFVHSVK